MIELALYQPDIPQNTGTLLRLCACWDIKMHLIEPLGFIFNEQKMRRSAMDYIDHVTYTRHANFDTFKDYTKQNKKRIVLSTTKGATLLQKFQFTENDIILMGRESAGVPDDVHEQADARIRIPMKAEMRSINMAVSASAMVTAAMLQTNGFDKLED
ncbi:MAG: tRNA (cytidine(34)-2'-O)-methyltransferase [Alphaproteobacteria bacterium]